MKETFIVAQNAFTISAPDNFAVWEAIRPRFTPFLALTTQERERERGEEVEEGESVLDINIKVGNPAKYQAETIYAPEHDGVGFISAQASLLPDNCLLMEFMHVADSKTRLWMKMPPELNRAEITIAPAGDSDDTFFIAHALMIAFMLATCSNGTLLIHSSSVLFEGKAYLFQGKSGTGKSTHASLWIQNIDGAELLNDDNPVIRFTPDGTATAYGSPWSGKTHCYRNLSAPIGAFVRIVRDSENKLLRLSPLKAYASLTSSIYYMPFLSEKLRAKRHTTIERLVQNVACCEMHCRPDADAALTCRRSLFLSI